MSDDRAPCRACGRKFNPESLTRHERVCTKQVSKKPRKVFDSGRQRAAGSDVPYTKTIKPSHSYAPNSNNQFQGGGYGGGGGGGGFGSGYGGGGGGGGGPKTGMKDPVAFQNRSLPQGKPQGKSNWRRQHEEFITAVRAAKAYGRAVKTGGPLPPPAPPSEHPDYVSCPTCGRRFNETAAQRHIPFCAEKSTRVATKKIPDANAKMRANARGYVAPTPGSKPKSTSGGGGRGSLMSTTTLSGANDYSYDSFSPSSSQAPRNGGPSQVRRAGAVPPMGGGGGAFGRSGYSRQTPDDEDFEAYQPPSQGPRGTRLGGGYSKTQPGVSGARLAPVSGGPSRGSIGGNSAVGMRSQGAAYMGSTPNGVPSRGGMARTTAAQDGGQFCYECGNQYPSKTAKFCVECGAKKI